MEGPSTNTISASKNSAWKVSKYGFFSGLYIGLNTGKYGPGKTPCLDIFHAVQKSPAMQARKIKIFFFNCMLSSILHAVKAGSRYLFKVNLNIHFTGPANWNPTQK